MADPPYVRTHLLIKVFKPNRMDAGDHEKVTRSDRSQVHDHHRAIVCVGNACLSLAAEDGTEHAV
jgi:hypothetical protein